MIFSLPGVTPSQNELDGKHWTVKHRLKTEWHEVVGWIARRNPGKATHARVEIVRVSKRLLDDLNVPAGCKWLLDAFVELGWLVDDSREWCRVTTDQRLCEKGEEPHMEVTISYLP